MLEVHCNTFGTFGKNPNLAVLFLEEMPNNERCVRDLTEVPCDTNRPPQALVQLLGSVVVFVA